MPDEDKDQRDAVSATFIAETATSILHDLLAKEDNAVAVTIIMVGKSIAMGTNIQDPETLSRFLESVITHQPKWERDRRVVDDMKKTQ